MYATAISLFDSDSGTNQADLVKIELKPFTSAYEIHNIKITIANGTFPDAVGEEFNLLIKNDSTLTALPPFTWWL